MRVIGGFGQPGDSDMPAGDSHEYATWDAAYVLGSLSPADRREFEAHLSGCPLCSAAVGELSGMPALLSKLDGGTVAAMDAGGHLEEPPNLLPSLMTEVRRRRRRVRMVTWTSGAAAAVLLAVALFVGIWPHNPASTPPRASVSALQMDQVGTKALASTVSLNSQEWGTYIDLNCVCLAPVTAHHDRLAMVVVGRDGTHTQLATWIADPGHTAKLAGSTSTPVEQISQVQVVSADDGRVLLQRSL
ncbi:zf-HC2 domain-containing protein [Mycobacterium paraterrae]|uniref:Zf-HC2 domain-containing protein n=2 Tax=Mycobacterium paraterrae TaxID=577492 RepID=A0ABY3VGU1_9MYCO|nr:zf-HC2 domain-containing protein [Mycobacterium paraterrae]